MQPEDAIINKKNAKNRVKVAIRVRPMIHKESLTNENSCVEFPKHNQIVIGKQRSFTFDKVFQQSSTQAEIYQNCVKDLVVSCFDGYNAAVLAYGQTGSGKTYTMGTGSNYIESQEEAGAIPRVITDIFEQAEKRRDSFEYVIKVSFIEIYNQQIIDLLTPVNANDNVKAGKNTLSKEIMCSLRQQKDGSISLVGVTEQKVTGTDQMLGLLKRGGLNRSTSATLMNNASSRSHGIFTINLEQHPKNTEQEGYITSKFYFVDLAGSQRAKKTGASGQTFKEGVNINLGLLELGNVISALSAAAEKKDNQFITYRNSKLTRILQDSLGGNSNTYMIACVSPADSNYQQSLNTLKYATKAMNIKNKPIINRDPHTTQINNLKQRINKLQSENREIRQIALKSGVKISSIICENLEEEAIVGISHNSLVPGKGFFQDKENHHNNTCLNTTTHRSTQDLRGQLLWQQIRKLRSQIQVYKRNEQQHQFQLKQQKKRKNQLQINNYELKRQRDQYRFFVQKYKNKQPMEDQYGCNEGNNEEKDLQLIEEYLEKIRCLENEVIQQEKINLNMQTQCQKLKKVMERDQFLLLNKNKYIQVLKNQIKKLKENHRNQNMNDQHDGDQDDVDQHDGDQDDEQDEQDQNQKQSIHSEELQGVEEDIIEEHYLHDYKQNQQEHEHHLTHVNKTISEQQRQLQAMTEEQINLEYQLISQMKEEYHKKINSLEREKQAMVKQQKDQGAYGRIDNKVKNKIDSLESELRDLRKKAREQNALEKQVSLQNQKIKGLANQLKQQKVQKIEITRKIKQDKNNFEKFKKDRMKQILREKRQNVKKDKQIRKLKLENKKKSIQIQKRSDELKRVKKVNQIVKIYTKNVNDGQKKINKRKRKLNWASHRSGKSYIQHRNHQQEEENEIKHMGQQWIRKVILRQQLMTELNKYEKRLQQLCMNMEKLQGQRAVAQLKFDRHHVSSIYETNNEKNEDIQEILMSINDIGERIANIEESIAYNQNRYHQLSTSDIIAQYSQQGLITQLIFNSILTSIPKLQLMLREMCSHIQNLVSEGISQRIHTEQIEAENQQLKNDLRKNKEELMKTIEEHRESLSRLRQQMACRDLSWQEELLHHQQQSETVSLQNNIPYSTNANNQVTNNNGKLDDRERKNYIKKIMDLNKTNRQLSADVEMWRRKCSIVQQKYHNINAKMAKDKFIGIGQSIGSRNHSITTNGKQGGWNISGANMIEEVNDLIQKLDHNNRRKNATQEMGHQNMNNNPSLMINEEENVSTHKNNGGHANGSDEDQFSLNSWGCLGSLQAANSPILSMAAHQNFLLTSATRNLTMWDQNNCQIIADFSAPLQGFVKKVIVLPNYSLIGAACEKSVFLWDHRTYETVNILKSHKDEVKTLYSPSDYAQNILFTAGKGTPNCGSLHIWDLRMLSAPIEEKEKNLDIFAVTSHQNILYYGTRTHQVRIMNIINTSQNEDGYNFPDYRMENMGSLEPPHMDTVTSLAVVKGYLISGSKDKNLRLWGFDGNNRFTVHAFNDYINIVYSRLGMGNGEYFYSGSRDGQVKIGKVSSIGEEKIKFVGGIMAHTQSVNDICSIGDQRQGMFATCSSDRTVKIWKPDNGTLQRITSQQL